MLSTPNFVRLEFCLGKSLAGISEMSTLLSHALFGRLGPKYAYYKQLACAKHLTASLSAHLVPRPCPGRAEEASTPGALGAPRQAKAELHGTGRSRCQRDRV